jgi:hypothetical protein
VLNEADTTVPQISGTGITGLPGDPMLPAKILHVGIPGGSSPQVRMLHAGKGTDFTGQIPPIPRMEWTIKKDTTEYETVYERNERVYSRDSFFPASRVSILGEYTIRDQRVVEIGLYPYRYNPVKGVLAFCPLMDCEISFNAPRSGTGKDLSARPAPDTHFESVFEDLLLNYPLCRTWRLSKKRLNAAHRTTDEDVFARSDHWLRVELREEGMHRITSDDIAEAGIDPLGIDPATIRMFYGGGEVLPEDPVEFAEIEEIPIAVESSGPSFGQNDSVVFFGESVRRHFYSSTEGEIEFRENPYTDINCYWLSWNGNFTGEPLRMVEIDGTPDGSPALEPDTFISVVREEREYENPTQSGPDWYWYSFYGKGDQEGTYAIELPDVDEGQPIRVKIRLKGESTALYSGRKARVYFNTVDTAHLVDEIEWFGRGSVLLDGSGQWASPDANRVIIQISREDPSKYDEVLLDWIEVHYQRRYSGAAGSLFFTSPLLEDPFLVRYDIDGFGEKPRIFDVSNSFDVGEISNGQFSGGSLLFQDISEGIASYIALEPGSYREPEHISQVRFDGLLKDSGNAADYLIITDESLFSCFDELRAWRESHDGLKAGTITLDRIYDEFSGGLCDPTAIRNFLYYAYHFWMQPAVSYVLFGGDGTFDIRNLAGVYPPKNIVPVHQVQRYEGYSTVEDWFADVGEDDAFPEMYVGRVNVQDVQDAEEVVSKLIDYSKDSEKGIWKGDVTIVADDQYSDTSENEIMHTRDSNILSTAHIPTYLLPRRIYLVEYPRDSFQNKPAARDDLIEAINEGTLMVSFLGHGNEFQLAHEEVLSSITDLPRIRNGKRTPCFYIGSCSVGRFDSNENDCLAEELVTHTEGGAIAVIAATCPTSGSYNARLDWSFCDFLMPEDKTSAQRIGQALVSAKIAEGISSYNVNNKFYILLGDPFSRLPIPLLDVEFTTLSPDTIAPLRLFTSSGRITDGTSQWTGSGQGLLQISDSAYIREYVNTAPPIPTIFRYWLNGSPVFQGWIDVSMGEFTGNALPSNDLNSAHRITMQERSDRFGENGRISMYFIGDDGAEAISGMNDLIVDGRTTVPADQEGPSITVWVGGQLLTDGFYLSGVPVFTVELEDERGINLTGKEGHEISCNLRKEGEVYGPKKDLTKFFIYDINSYQKGHLEFSTPEISNDEGKYYIRFTAFDNTNRKSEKEVFFNVLYQEKIRISNPVNYPNPFKKSTYFTWEASWAESDPVTVSIKIYTINGRLIKTIDNTDSHWNHLWDGRDEEGDPVANGVYFYKITAKSTDLQNPQRATAIGKLAVMK